MRTRICSAVVVISLCTCVPVRAALYEFTVQGQVTQAFWPNVAVGDAFTIRYTADTQDEESAATLGRYDASAAVVTLPNTTITSTSLARVRVLLNQPAGTDRVVFERLGFNYNFDIDFTFPAGTLATDELPLALPLSSATTSSWGVYDFGPRVAGNVTSYTSAEVPEPAAVSLALTTALAALRRRRALPGFRIACRYDRALLPAAARSAG